MQSTATDVDTYLTEVPEARREVLTAIRMLCLEHLPGCAEGMTYGMPTYSKDGVGEVAFASQKQYISIYAKQDVLDAHRAEFTGASIGKCCIRYRNPAKVDLAAVARLIEAAAASCGSIC